MNDPERPSKPRRTSSARMIALRVLCRVDEDQAYANLELNQELRNSRLSPQDAAFATELVSGTLREQLFYDAVIERAGGRSSEALNVVTRNILRLGAHQLLTLQSQAYAAVNESVELQKSEGQRGGAGLVNAVLRRISEREKEEWMLELERSTNTMDRRLSLRYSHPEWIIRALRDSLQNEGRVAELSQLLEADNQAPLVHLAILSRKMGEPSETVLAGRLPESVTFSGPSPVGAVLLTGSPAALIRDRDESDELDVRVQDQGSQLAALALTRAPLLSRSESESWLDLCSGPGGKTAILAYEAAEKGSSLRAVEISEHRAKLVSNAVSRSPARVVVATEDGTREEAFAGQHYDRILLDAPCTGLGALRRRPDARLRKQPSDVGELVRLQRSLLEAAALHLKPGGMLAYVTCSPLLAETRMNIDHLLGAHPELIECDAREVVNQITRSELDLSSAHKSVQLWPHRHGTDAMFIALVQRRVEA